MPGVNQSLPSVWLDRLTWPEIQAGLAAGVRTAVIVAASVEQHGPHLPEGTDTFLGEAIAERVARKLGDALAAPVIRPGCSDHHMAFPGTITISPETLMDILDSYVDSLRVHGFERFLVTSSHGGNFPVLRNWAGIRPKPGVVVLYDLEGFCQSMFAGIRRFGRTDSTLPHADVMETSEMLLERPELVRRDRIESGFVGEVPSEQLFEKGLRAFTSNGVLGNPLGASPEMGLAVLESLTDWMVELATAGFGPY